MYLFVIILIILFILFFPFKIKFYFSYIDSKISFKLFNFSILPKKNINTSVSSTKRFKKKKLKKKKKFNLIKKEDITPNKIFSLISSVNRRKYKPKLFFNFNLNYSFEDPKNTALSFGLIHSIFPFLFKIMSIVFSLKENTININPLFKNKLFLAVESRCIIKTSIGQIIYTTVILLKELYKIRRCP